MKISSTQLRKIIEEEVKKARLNEAEDPKKFYANKWDKLDGILDKIEDIRAALHEIETDESRAPGGDVDEMMGLHAGLDSFEEQVTGLMDAVDAMI
jgi:hypothetical protein